jgi:hypothetical protein
MPDVIIIPDTTNGPDVVVVIQEGPIGPGANMSTSAAPTTVTILNDVGTPAVLGTASGDVAGIMTAAQFTKLDGIATGATANSADATLLARANHTGTQSWSTLTDVPPTFTPTAHNHAATEITSGTLPVARLSFTKAELDTAVSDGNVLYVGDVTSNATHTGDVTGDTALTIANSAVTLAKMANLAQDQFIGRTTASTGVPETATITAAARTVLDDATVGAMVDTLGGASSTGTGGLMRAASPTTTGSLSAAEIVFSADARFTEQVYTPTGTTQTIDLNDGNLNTLTLGSTTGNVTLTLTVPTSAASGRIKIIQHGTTVRDITISLSSLTAKWFSVIPTWTSQAVGKHTILSYTRDGSFMNFSAVEEV